VFAKLTEVSKSLQQSNEMRAAARAKVMRLTPREREVIGLVVEGNSNKSIARLLSLSPRTVEIHRTKAMSRLGVQNSSEAVRVWLIGSENL
jgi:DNA-binding CsgD family transcriptional regulator